MLYSTRLLVPLLLAEVVGTAVMVAALLSDGFSLVREAREKHTTPWGSSQACFYGFSGGNEPNPRRRITEWRLTMGCLVATALAAVLLSAMGGVQEPATRTEANTPQGVRVFNTRSVKEPENAAAELVDLHASDHMVTRVMRLAPGATIKEHRHPFFDETFFVHAGSLKMVLDDKEHELRSGDTVIMPAGTIIAGTNTGSEEAVVVIVWANIGKKGPLFVHGRPDQQKKEKR